MYVMYVCNVCMYVMYVCYVCNVCMYVMYVCNVCMYVYMRVYVIYLYTVFSINIIYTYI